MFQVEKGKRSGSVPTDKKFTGQRLDTTGLYYYNARYYDPLIGRFISADTIVPNPADPQCFNRYSYCLNNPLKYIDPSGHETVTVKTQEYTDDQKAYARILGLDIEIQYTITSSNGSKVIVNSGSADNSASDSGVIPGVVYEIANKMRENERDNELNIVWTSHDLTLIDHYASYEGGNPTLTEQYYINSSGRLELISSSNYEDPRSWGNILRYTAGAFIMTVGIVAMYFGCAFFYCSYVLPYMGNQYMRYGGGLLAFFGWEAFTFGYDYASNENRQWYNIFEMLLTP